jgi:hypothetical protein
MRAPLSFICSSYKLANHCCRTRCDAADNWPPYPARLMESPATLMLAELVRARDRGAPFADCWPGALETACNLHPEASEWLEALAATKGAWERAFYGRPSRAEEALSLLREGRGEPIVPERRCALWSCGADMSDRVPQARYCSSRCARRAAHMRELMVRQRAPEHPEIKLNGYPQSAGLPDPPIGDETPVTH